VPLDGAGHSHNNGSRHLEDKRISSLSDYLFVCEPIGASAALWLTTTTAPSSPQYSSMSSKT